MELQMVLYHGMRAQDNVLLTTLYRYPTWRR